LLLWAQQPGDIDRLMHSWWSAAVPQHGMQQQMLRVPHCQLMWEADCGLFSLLLWTSLQENIYCQLLYRLDIVVFTHQMLSAVV